MPAFLAGGDVLVYEGTSSSIVLDPLEVADWQANESFINQQVMPTSLPLRAISNLLTYQMIEKLIHK